MINLNKLCITGSSGFVGQNLVQYFKKNSIELYELTREKLNSADFLFSLDTKSIVHLAGKAHDLKQTSNPEEYYKINFELTKKLYDAFLKSKANKFIFISSVKASADSVSGVLNEDDLPNPKTHYGKSKLMAEQYIQSQELPFGKSYYILRPCMIHGPGNKGNLNLLYKFVRKGIPYPLASFENKRSFLSIDNLCFIIKELLEKEINSGVYNVADDDFLSTNEVINILSETLGRKTKLWKLSPTLIKFLARIGDKINSPLNTERLNKLTESYVISNVKIKNVIDNNLPMTAREGLKVTAKSFFKHEFANK